VSEPLPSSMLNPAQRAESWARLGSEQFDVVVIGGGVVGAGAALDAATRGLKVALVEARDMASGTSSRSSKMFHGGLRYLEQLEFGLVREALHERELSLKPLAPHLVKPLPFLFPLTKRWWERPYMAAGYLPLRPAGRRQVGARPEAHVPRRCAAAGARPQAQLAGRRHPLLRHRRRRRPAHHDPGPHRGPLRRGGAHVHPGGRLAAGGRPGGRGQVRDSRDRRGHRGARALRGERHGVWTDEVQALSGSAAGSRCAPPRGCTSWCRATGSSARSRSSCARREVGAVRHPVGDALDHRHHRHRLEPGPRASGRDQAPTSTTSWTGSTAELVTR
jgi:glycerol-3-phosphate dehydrogenase